MKKTFLLLTLLLFTFTYATAQTSGNVAAPSAQQLSRLGLKGATLQKAHDGIWSVRMGKKKSGHIINSTPYAQSIRGYRGATPVLVYVDAGGTVKKLMALQNRETPEYFQDAEPLLRRWVGKQARKAETMNVDVVTGATYSSKGLIGNVRAALKAYREHIK